MFLIYRCLLNLDYFTLSPTINHAHHTFSLPFFPLQVARQVEDGYNELLKVLKNNPPYIESHVKALEIEVQLAQKQFEDMCEHRNNLYHETEAANENKVNFLLYLYRSGD